MKNLILLCAIVCCANGCLKTIKDLHDRLHKISMKECQCHDSLDGNICNVTTGQCGQCKPGFFGDFCKVCDCNSNGTTNEVCDKLDGSCTCSDGHHGKQCQFECNCNLQGSKNNKCRPDSGKCECKDGYSGIHCDFDFPIGPINLIVGGIYDYYDYDYDYDDQVSDGSDAQIVDLSSQTRSCNNFPDYPIAMDDATGAMVSGQPIICGGSSRSSYHSECYKYTTNTWTPLTKMSTKRASSASVPVKGKLLVLGGWDGDNRLATSEYVSPDGDASQPGPDLPGPRSSHCAVKLSNGQIMLLGGFPDEKSVIIFNPDTGIDQSLPPLTFERYQHGCAAFNSPMHDNREVVLAVGGAYQATAEVLDYTQPNPAWTQILGNVNQITPSRRGCRRCF